MSLSKIKVYVGDKTLLSFGFCFFFGLVFFCVVLVVGFFSVERYTCACEKERGSMEASLKNIREEAESQAPPKQALRI